MKHCRGSARAPTTSRFTVYREWLEETYGLENLRSGGGVLDVAGGKGDLALKLLIHAGIPTTIVDPRPMDVPNMLRHITRSLLHRLAQRQSTKETKPSSPKHVTIPFPKHIRTWFWYPLEKAVECNPETYVNDPLQPVPVEHSGLEEALKNCSAIVGMHSDQATEAIVDWGLELNKPFATVPCCVFPNLFPTRSHVRKHGEFLKYLVAKDASRVHRAKLDFAGRNDVIYGGSVCAKGEKMTAKDKRNLGSEKGGDGDGNGNDSQNPFQGQKKSEQLREGKDEEQFPPRQQSAASTECQDTKEPSSNPSESDKQEPTGKSSSSLIEQKQTRLAISSEPSYRMTDSVILPWSQLAKHLQETGEDEGAVYESLADEFSQFQGFAADNLEPSEQTSENQHEVKALPEPLAACEDSATTPLPKLNLTPMPSWMFEPRACPATKELSFHALAYRETHVAVILCRWALATTVLYFLGSWDFISASLAMAMIAASLQNNETQELLQTWFGVPGETLAVACQAYEIEMARALRAIKRRELLRRGFTLRSLAPPIGRIERNECLRNSELRRKLEVPKLRTHILTSLLRIARAFQNPQQPDHLAVDEPSAIPLISDLEKATRSMVRARARFAKSNISMDDCLALVQTLRLETRQFCATTIVQEENATSDAVTNGAARIQKWSKTEMQVLNVFRTELNALRQHLAHLDTSLWVCEQQAKDLQPGRNRDTKSNLEELAMNITSLQQNAPSTLQRLNLAFNILQGDEDAKHLRPRSTSDGNDEADGEEGSDDGHDARSENDRDIRDGDGESNQGALLAISKFTDVYQGFVEEPEPYQRRKKSKASGLLESAMDENQRIAALANNMLGELGNVLTHRQADLAPERVVRTQGKNQQEEKKGDRQEENTKIEGKKTGSNDKDPIIGRPRELDHIGENRTPNNEPVGINIKDNIGDAESYANEHPLFCKMGVDTRRTSSELDLDEGPPASAHAVIGELAKLLAAQYDDQSS